MGDAYEVTVVVCAYTFDRWADIVDGVRALARQSCLPAEVIVVIDHNPELADRARSELPREFDRLQVIENKHERGLSGARNTAIEQATQPVIAFLDDDAIPELDWLAQLVLPFDDPSVMASGGRAEPKWPDERPGWFPSEFDWVVGCSYRGMPTAVATMRNVMGCSMAFRADVFKRVGTFTEGIGRIGRLPLGCEETELCIRIAQLPEPTRIVYTPASLVHHRVSADRTKIDYFLRRCLAEGRSKAAIGALIGYAAGTSTERDYTLKVLPRGVLRSMLATVKGDLSGAARAGAIVVGLAFTVTGYLAARLAPLNGSIRQRLDARRRR